MSASITGLLMEAEALQQAPLDRSLLFEIAMARRALEAEYERNRLLCKLHFCHDDSASTTASESEAPLSCSSEASSLWSLPPLADDARPFEVAIVAGHSVSMQALAAVESAFSSTGVRTLRLQASAAGDEAELAAMAPRRTICVLGDHTVMNRVVNGIMRRADREDVTVALLPSESSKLSVLHEMGIETAQDGIFKVLNGRVRHIDVLEYLPLADGAKPHYFLDSAVYGRFGAHTSRANKMKGIVGDTAANKLAALHTLAENAHYVARLEMPEGEVSEEFRRLIAKPRAYHSVSVHNSQRMVWSSMAFDGAASAKADDGRFEVVLSKAKSRLATIKNFERIRGTGALDLKEAGDHELCFASVTSLTVMGETVSIPQLDQLTDLAEGTSFRISVAPTKLKVYA